MYEIAASADVAKHKTRTPQTYMDDTTVDLPEYVMHPGPRANPTSGLGSYSQNHQNCHEVGHPFGVDPNDVESGEVALCSAMFYAACKELKGTDI